MHLVKQAQCCACRRVGAVQKWWSWRGSLCIFLNRLNVVLAGESVLCRSLVITTGTFLRGTIHIGSQSRPAGRMPSTVAAEAAAGARCADAMATDAADETAAKAAGSFLVSSMSCSCFPAQCAAAYVRPPLPVQQDSMDGRPATWHLSPASVATLIACIVSEMLVSKEGDAAASVLIHAQGWKFLGATGRVFGKDTGCGGLPAVAAEDRDTAAAGCAHCRFQRHGAPALRRAPHPLLLPQHGGHAADSPSATGAPVWSPPLLWHNIHCRIHHLTLDVKQGKSLDGYQQECSYGLHFSSALHCSIIQPWCLWTSHL